MTVIARRFRSIPDRSALETWRAICDLLAAEQSSTARGELDAITGVASSLITREALRDSALILHGSGPRVRIYCLYGEDAITGDNESEQPLAFNATSGDWQMSLPCRTEDLKWVQAALKKLGAKITARDFKADVEDEPEQECKSGGLHVNREAFFRS